MFSKSKEQNGKNIRKVNLHLNQQSALRTTRT